MARNRKARELLVSATASLTKNMQRVTLFGEDLADFPTDAEGAYFKFAFPSGNPEKPILRTYTVAKYRPKLHEIDVDFMLHTVADGSTKGVAALWAMHVKPGESISIYGPGPASYINTDADWYLLAADMTALPALIANISRLPINASGYVVVEIIANEDKQSLALPYGMNVIWVINSHPGSDDSVLSDAIKNLDWLDGQVGVWVACEFKTMKIIRQYCRQSRNIEKSHLYVSSYWKMGLQEEQHKKAKRDDAKLLDGGVFSGVKKVISALNKK